MKIIGHIGIRTGSKGVKNKNIRNFNGVPLFLNKLKKSTSPKSCNISHLNHINFVNY